jgi:peroxiredoxin
METLQVGTRFPDLEARATDGSTVAIPRDLEGSVAVLLFYRGHW